MENNLDKFFTLLLLVLGKKKSEQTTFTIGKTKPQWQILQNKQVRCHQFVFQHSLRLPKSGLIEMCAIYF